MIRNPRIGIISDTHGLLRPEAVAALQGCDVILHAGDIGKPHILDELHRIAPVTAVRGNVDTGPWAATLPERVRVEAGGLRILMLHDLKQLDRGALASGTDVVISGHSHVPRVEERQGVLFVNPGSAGPRRFRLPVSLAFIEKRGGKPVVALVDLVPGKGINGAMSSHSPDNTPE